MADPQTTESEWLQRRADMVRRREPKSAAITLAPLTPDQQEYIDRLMGLMPEPDDPRLQNPIFKTKRLRLSDYVDPAQAFP